VRSSYRHILSWLAVALACLGVATMVTAATAVAPPSAHDLTRAPAISQVSISPDGLHIAALTSPDGVKTYISIWSTAAMGERPKTLASEFQRIDRVRFIKNDRLEVDAIQTFTGPASTRAICTRPISSTSTARSGPR